MHPKRLLLVSIIAAPLAATSIGAGAQDEEQRRQSRSGPPLPAGIAQMVSRLTGTPTGTVIYRGAALIDGTGAPLREDMAIVVDGERISSVVATSDLDASRLDNAEVIDADGWFALPGLIDSHVHLATLPDRESAEAVLYRQVYAGVTTVRDMAGDARAVSELSRRSRIREIPAPDIHFSALIAGPSFFSDPRTIMSSLGETPGEVPWLQAVTEDTDLRLAVARLIGTHATGIKIYANLPGATVRNVIAEAHRQEIPIWTHMQVFPATPHDLIEAGATTVSHVCMIPGFILKPGTGSFAESFAPLDKTNRFSTDDPAVAAIFASMRDNDVILDATISMLRDVDSPRTSGDEDEDESVPPWICTQDVARDLVRLAHETGVRLVSGTDWRAPSEDRFPAVYREFEALAEGTGMSNMDVMLSGTANGAAALGLGDRIGTIESGKFANLVFMSENPLDDVGNLRSVVLTVKRGTRYPRDEYEHRGIPDRTGFN